MELLQQFIFQGNNGCLGLGCALSSTIQGGLFALGMDVLAGGWESISSARAGTRSWESKGQTGSAESREK